MEFTLKLYHFTPDTISNIVCIEQKTQPTNTMTSIEHNRIDSAGRNDENWNIPYENVSNSLHRVDRDIDKIKASFMYLLLYSKFDTDLTEKFRQEWKKRSRRMNTYIYTFSHKRCCLDAQQSNKLQFIWNWKHQV